MEVDTTDEHVPVMLSETIELLAPQNGGLYCDGTAGRGGHALALLEASSPKGRLLALDRDPVAVQAVRSRLAVFGDRVEVHQCRYSELRELLEQNKLGKLDGLLLDLGVSSPQLDTASRGFSFQLDGPIDMRLDPSTGETALEMIESLGEDELARALRDYGEERRARRVARALKEAAVKGELRTTLDLARVVRRALGQRKTGKIDAATRTFQGLRILVNDELGELKTLLAELPELLVEGGRAAFISFHSLEDRSVKQGLRRWATCRCAPRALQCTCGGPLLRLLTRKPLRPSAEELNNNPRARSAKLRAAERISGNSQRGVKVAS